VTRTCGEYDYARGHQTSGGNAARTFCPTDRDSRAGAASRYCTALWWIGIFRHEPSVKRTRDHRCGRRNHKIKTNVWAALPTRLNATVPADNWIIGKSPRLNCKSSAPKRGPARQQKPQCRSRSWSAVDPSIPLRLEPAQASLARHAWLADNLGQRRRPKHTHRSVVASFQKRKRNPTVGAMLLRWRKPKANPPFTCVNMIPE
jgi:hypothetical protein